MAGRYLLNPILVGFCFALISGGDSKSKSDGGKITLKLNMSKGEKHTVVVDVETETTVSEEDKLHTTKAESSAEITFEVQEIESNGNHLIKVTYDRMRMKVDAGSYSLDFDSKNGTANDPRTKPMAVWIGQELTFQFRPNGSLAEISGIEELAEKGGINTPGGVAALRQQLESNKQSMAPMLAILPEKAVEVNDTWSSKLSMAGGAKAPTMDIDYSLADRKNGEVTIKADGTFSSDDGVSGTLKGTLYLDEKTGWTKRAEVIVEMTGKENPIEKISMKMKLNSK